MKLWTAVLVAGLLAGCGRKPVEETKPTPVVDKGTEGMKPVTDMGKPKDPEKPVVVRKVTHPEKKGLIATYHCECTKKEWTQPAEEEKLCIEWCGGKMPKCGTLVKEEAAAK